MLCYAVIIIYLLPYLSIPYLEVCDYSLIIITNVIFIHNEKLERAGKRSHADAMVDKY